MSPLRPVRVRKKFDFLRETVHQLTPARISLEGNLSRCNFPDELVVAREELQPLRRNTTWPPQDFVVLALSDSTRDQILREILQAGFKHGILHVQIEQDGELQLAAYDSLHEDCVAVGSKVTNDVLKGWKAAGLIAGYDNVEATA